jgi:murein DD-endopeptidase MepM/ murein hydrolase activator NlpD
MRRKRRAAVVALGAGVLALAPLWSSAATMPGYLRPVRGPIIRHFERPATPYSAGHRGIDLAVPIGTPIVASNAGTVAFAGAVAGQLYISIDHADGIRTTYSYVSLVSVRKGDAVARGQQIGLSGPGDPVSPQPCLHFGMRVGDTYLDPEPFLIDGLRRDISQAIRLAPDEEASGGPVAARDSIPAAGPILAGALALRFALRRRVLPPMR